MRMIVWINGSFGVGKTAVALALSSQIENSFVFDPEVIGSLIQKLTPQKQKKSDFQDYPLWRVLVVKILLYASKYSRKTVIVPMTVVNQKYHDELFGGLRKHNKKLKHIALIASKETILERLEMRGDSFKSWPAQQIERCLKGLQQLDNVYRIDTNKLTIAEVIAEIEEHLGCTKDTRI